MGLAIGCGRRGFDSSQELDDGGADADTETMEPVIGEASNAMSGRTLARDGLTRLVVPNVA